MGQNVLGQSDCRIFKSTPLEQNDKKKRDFLHVDTDLWILKVE